jgi:hypothetical protein
MATLVCRLCDSSSSSSNSLPLKPLSPRNKIAKYLIDPAVFVVKLLQVVVEQNPQVILDRLARAEGGGFEGVLSDWRSSWADWVMG